MDTKSSRLLCVHACGQVRPGGGEDSVFGVLFGLCCGRALMRLSWDGGDVLPSPNVTVLAIPAALGILVFEYDGSHAVSR